VRESYYHWNGCNHPGLMNLMTGLELASTPTLPASEIPSDYDGTAGTSSGAGLQQLLARPRAL